MANDEQKEDGPSMSDAIRRLVSLGISAAFMTEEAVRSRVSELKLPKETLTAILAGASKSKDELMNRVGQEIIRMINRIDFVSEASRFVEEHKFKISAEVEVIKREPIEPKKSPAPVGPTEV